jgi:hypothetical protein
MSRRVLCLAVALWLATPPLHTAGAQISSGQDAKAAFLVNFVKFTQWPADVFSSPNAPVIVGVAGDEVLRYTIERLVHGKLFNERTVETRNVKDAADAGAVHIVFMSALTGTRGQDILKSVRELPILTVGDSDGFCESGGMIGFLVERDRLRFEISVGATELARLKVSSRVLTLAKTVYGKK